VSLRRLLFHHFLRQHASFEATSTGGEAKYVVIAVVSLLAGPGYLAAVSAARAGRTLGTRTPACAAGLWLWKQWLHLTSLLVAVAARSDRWRSFVLGRDFRILGLLPCPAAP
jgi:hypothetical protein